MNLGRILAAGLLGGASLAAATVVSTAAPASADYGCPGSPYLTRDFRDSAGRLAATTQVHETASGWCVQVVSKGIYAGKAKYMRVRVCKELREACKEDAGTYSSYAGPITYRRGNIWVLSTSKDGNGGTIMDHWDCFVCN